MAKSVEMYRIQLAALNNAQWCAAVWRAHGLRTEQSAGAWFTRGATPSLYPNVVTVAHTDPEQQVAIAVELASGLGRTSVKDSYGILPLASRGYYELFSAEWLWAEPESLSAAESSPNCERVVDPACIAEWIDAWTRAGGAANNLLPDIALDNGVEVWGKRTVNGQFYAGLTAYRSSEVVGITNLFGSPSGLLSAVSAEGRDALCCYQHGRALRWAMDQGFRPIGPLKVWVRGQI